MALYIDGTPANIALLRNYDSSIEQVAADERIDLDAKLKISAEELGHKILRFLLDQGSGDQQDRRRRTGLADVVVNSGVRHWHAVHTLASVYRDAYGKQLNDRYGNKLKMFARWSNEASHEAFAIGIGVASSPIPKAGLPQIVPGGGESGRSTVYVRAAWSNAEGGEGAASDTIAVDLGPGDQVELSVPDGVNVSGWNLFIGATPDSLGLQNAEPLPPGTPWIIPMYGFDKGRAPEDGQRPDYFVVECRLLRRG